MVRSPQPAARGGGSSSDGSEGASPLLSVRPSGSPLSKLLGGGRASSESESESDNNSNSKSGKGRLQAKQQRRQAAPSDERRALRRAVEHKFRLRYDALQQAYEQRLRALAAQVMAAAAQFQQDAAVRCLQEDPLTLEFASARLGEIVQESFFGEREKHVKAMSDQIAWQASDLRELQHKLRLAQRRESEAQQQCKVAQRDLAAVHHQLELRVQELQEHKAQSEKQQEKLADALAAKDSLRTDVETLKHAVQSLTGVKSEYAEFKERVHTEQQKEERARSDLSRSIKEMETSRAKLELEKQASQQEVVHLQQLLRIAESKVHEMSGSLQELQRQEYPAKLARVEAELEHQHQQIATLEKENESLRQRYEEFGAQVDQYMHEQAEERVSIAAMNDEQVKSLEAQIDDTKRQAQDALRSKQQELLRMTDQLKIRHEALNRMEQKNAALHEQIASLETQLSDEKLRAVQQVGRLEKDIAQGRVAVEREQEKVQLAKRALIEVKEKYEAKIKTLQEKLTLHSQQTLKEKEMEARTRWQNEFMAKQEARMETLKAKYDAALENQRNDLASARQAALESASIAAAKLEHAQSARKQEEEQESLRRAEAIARENKHKEDAETDRARVVAHKKTERELEEREKRLMERERVVTERETFVERRRQAVEAEQKQVKEKAATVARSTAASVSAAPNVVVLNVSSDENESRGQSLSRNIEGDQGGKTIKVVNKVPTSAKLLNDAYISRGQHEAELQAREAQAALRAEEKAKQLAREFEERKEKEFRFAMVNVRKGIQKLEISLDEARADKKSIEEQLLDERQAFVILKQENEELKESKTLIVLRLEEANENIGRLRVIVKESRDKCRQLDEQFAHAQRESEVAVKSSHDAERSVLDLKQWITELEHAKSKVEASLNASESGRKELQEYVISLEAKLREQRNQFDAEKMALGEQTSKELQSTSVQFDSRVQALESQVDTLESIHRRSEEQVEALKRDIGNLQEEKKSVETGAAEAKKELAQQRKEFADLSRMYKNLKGSMQFSVEDEQSKRAAAETQSLELVNKLGRITSQKGTDLRACRWKLQQLSREWVDMKKSVQSDLQLSWTLLSQDASTQGLAWQMQLDALLTERDNKWRQRITQDKDEWKRRLAQKESEMDAMLSDHRMTDQSKYDQLAQRLEEKSKDAQQLEAQLNAQMDVTSSQQQTIQRLEHDTDYRLQELASLRSSLAITEAKTRQSEQDKADALSAVEKWRRIADTLRTFVASIAQDKQPQLDNSIASTTVGSLPPLSDVSWSDSGDLQELSRQLSQIRSLVRENGEKIVASAKHESLQPLESELAAAKKCLEPYWRPVFGYHSDIMDSDTSIASDDTFLYYQHLPWFVAVDQAIKRIKRSHDEQLALLRKDITNAQSEKQAASDTSTQLQETINVLRFEKETLLREMELLSNTLAKRKEQELSEQRSHFERRLDHAKIHAEHEHIKTEQDLQYRAEQLQSQLEAERRVTTNAKTDAITFKMELERVQEEFRDMQHRLEKQVDEMRDACNKWKRKAKIAVKANSTAVLPGTTASLLLSSASFSTEGDSDMSFRTLVLTPRRRRPSRAMADLSNLMEQSLSTIRREATSAPPMPRSFDAPEP